MEDRFEKLTKTTSGWVYFVKYFDELEIKQDKGNFERAGKLFQGLPFFYHNNYFVTEAKEQFGLFVFGKTVTC